MTAALVLASASASRAAMLRAAGVVFETEPARVDEAEIKDGLRADGATPAQIAETLAEAKAAQVSRRVPAALVIGADQTLACGGRMFDKPTDSADARNQLGALAGRDHHLHSAVCVMRDGHVAWHHNATATLTMRPLSDAFLDHYLAAMGDAVCATVGGYQLEGLGAQLFHRVDGDYFTVLGLPLLPLLDHLRAQGVLPS